MTQIDGLSLPVRLPIDGDAFDAACDYAREHGLTISAAASEMLRQFAPPVESGFVPCTPGGGRGDGGEPSAPLSPVLTLAESKRLHPSSRPAVHDVSEVITQPIPHVHLGLNGHPCVYGDRCSTGTIA